MLQTTIKKSVACAGIGLHSGRKVRLVLRPAAEDTGILFALQNGGGRRFLKPRPEAVISTGLSTTLGVGKHRVSTVEHLLAAVRGMGVDNIVIDVEGGEVPIMDGSAASFVYLLRMAGLRDQTAPRKVLALNKSVEYVSGEKYIRAEPHDGFSLDYTISFEHPLIGCQRMHFDVTPDRFVGLVSKARTFGFANMVEQLRANGMALGGSLDNAVVLDDYGVLNTEGLRFEDEFVRHKALDFIGDMAVLRLPLWGKFTVFASGHTLNNAFLRHIEQHADEYLREVRVSDATTAAGAEVEDRNCVPDMDTGIAPMPA